MFNETKRKKTLSKKESSFFWFFLIKRNQSKVLVQKEVSYDMI